MTNYALITGASSGIGLEFARIHASKGGHCLLVARSTEKLIELKNELEAKYKIQVHILSVDLTEPGACRQIYDYAKSEQITIEILFNNAGFGTYGEFHLSEWQKQADMIKLNVLALVELTHLFLPDMLANGSGKILNNASVAAFMPGPLMAVYFATKAFVLHFSEAVGAEVKSYGVHVLAVCYGPVKTNFQKVAGMESSKLVKGTSMPDSRTAAEFAYLNLQKNKPVAVYGWDNKLLTLLVRLLPRKWVVSMALKVQKSK